MRLLHLHRWQQVRDTGVHLYEQCSCGRRRIRRLMARGYQPVDEHWLETGEWRPEPCLPPPRPAAR